MKIRYTANASAELTQIFDYVAHENPRAAAAIVRRVEVVVGRLALFPGMGHACDVPGVLIAPLVRYPYAIYYTVEDDDLIVLHIHHSARRPPEFHETTSEFRR
ncbi:MAG: type II toxin-antitoxin system RelE/ParE family toxin [Rhizomicrobium sp.]